MVSRRALDEGERVAPADAAEWGRWLAANHERNEGCWLVTHKKRTGRQEMTYEEAVTEALRFGWVDSLARALDDERTMLWFAPRRPDSGWSRPNKRRIARLQAEGRLEAAGLAAVEAAKANGSWSLLDEVEDLVVPPDLAAAFEAHPGSRAHWDSFPPSARRAILEWIAQARRRETRARRVNRPRRRLPRAGEPTSGVLGTWAEQPAGGLGRRRWPASPAAVGEGGGIVTQFRSHRPRSLHPMSSLPVEIVRSRRRKRTLQASVVAGTIRVQVPAGMPAEQERRMVEQLVAKLQRKLEAGRIDLAGRAAELARRYDLPQPSEVSWSDRQNLRWGSCTTTRGSIRISTRLRRVPDFVLDYVLVHELAHLRVAGHGKEFWALVGRYPLAERARGYLMALAQEGREASADPAER